MDTISTAAAPAAVTWEAKGEEIVKHAAAWVLGHAVLGNRPWNTLVEADMGRGMELIAASAKLHGIMAGTVPATSADLLDAVKGTATEAALPTATLPQPVPVIAPEPAPTVSGAASVHGADSIGGP